MDTFPSPNPFGFRKKSRRPRTRLRGEFLGLCKSIEPFVDQAWAQFADELEGRETPRVSYQEKFRLLEKFVGKNARRYRYNHRRRLGKLPKVRAILRARQRGLVTFAALIRNGRSWQGLSFTEIVSGVYAIDLRLTRKLAREFDVVEEWLYSERDPAAIPVSQGNAGTVSPEATVSRLHVASRAGVWAGRMDFLEQLDPTPLPLPVPSDTAEAFTPAAWTDENAQPTQETTASSQCA